MEYLTPEQVLFLHARIMQETGGAQGVFDMSLLLSAVARPQAVFASRELYPDVFSKASALMDSLVRNHPFLDGNKRTAITAAGIFLRRNGWNFLADQDEVVIFTLDCAQSRHTVESMSVWFQTHSKPITDSNFSP